MTANLIYEALLRYYPDAEKSITEISRNTDTKNDFIVSDRLAFNFDLVKNCRHSGRDARECSPDALFVDSENIYFVEFKEGKPDRANVRSKIHEGILTLFQFSLSNDVLSKSEFMSLDISYFVIFRPKKRSSMEDVLVRCSSENFFGLKNMEGFLLKEAKALCEPKKIINILNKVSRGEISKMTYKGRGKDPDQDYSVVQEG